MAINYLDYQKSVTSPLQAAMAGYQSGLQLKQGRIQRAEAERKRAEAAQMKTDLANLAGNKNATPQDYTNMMLKYPSLAESLKAPLASLTEQQAASKRGQAMNVYAALETGQTDMAKSLLEKQLEAATNAGNQRDADGAQVMLNAINADPERAKEGVRLFLSATMGPEAFAETWTKLQSEQREAALLQGKLDKQAKDLGLTDAQITKAKAEAKKITAEVGKTNKEAKQVAIDTKLKQLEYKKKQQESGITLTGEGEKLVNKAVQEQINLTSLANQYDALGDQITTELDSGLTEKAYETVKQVWGAEDEVTRLRQEYRRLRNSQVLQSLPPGVASDKDIETAMASFPDEFADPGTIASFLKGMAKLNRYDASINGAKAEWVSQIGSLRPATKDIVIEGKEFKKGDTFADVVDGLFEPVSPIDTPSSQVKPTPEPTPQPAAPDASGLSDKARNLLNSLSPAGAQQPATGQQPGGYLTGNY